MCSWLAIPRARNTCTHGPAAASTMSFDSMHYNECIHSSISLEKEKNIFSSDILPSYVGVWEVMMKGDDVGEKRGRGKERVICVLGR